MTTLFNPGRTVITGNALELLTLICPPVLDEGFYQVAPHGLALGLLERHISGDWGDLDEHDKAVNDERLRSGFGKLLSSYNVRGEEKIWIITEGGNTTILLPSDY